MPYWALVRTHTGKEQWARRNIEAQGLKVLCPLIIKQGMKYTREALYPGYVFAEVWDAWMFLKGTFGVIDVITSGGKPQKVPWRLIHSLQAAMNEEGEVGLPSRRALIHGEQVIIDSGSFKNFVGVYNGDTSDDRIAVLFEFMGQRVSYDIERHKVSPMRE